MSAPKSTQLYVSGEYLVLHDLESSKCYYCFVADQFDQPDNIDLVHMKVSYQYSCLHHTWRAWNLLPIFWSRQKLRPDWWLSLKFLYRVAKFTCRAVDLYFSNWRVKSLMHVVLCKYIKGLECFKEFITILCYPRHIRLNTVPSCL